MKTAGLLLIGLGTGFILYLSRTNPDQSLDSSIMLTLVGIYFLTFGFITDRMTSQHSNNDTH